MEEVDNNKCKGGRLPKDIAQQKKRIVSIRFSEVEYYAIVRRTSLAGMTVSAYSHSAIMDGKIVEPVKKTTFTEKMMTIYHAKENITLQLAFRVGKLGRCRFN
ncbi:hypothetical protein FACS189431_6930 [Alphaproteobacteria bacterium]|nr:hypothetical protein FACS189431_6930 [Alphaproteobacteria bacterium]